MQGSIFCKNTIIPSLCLALFLYLPACKAAQQTGNEDRMAQRLSDAYERYREATLSDRRFKYESVVNLVTQRTGGFKVEEIGKSVEGKSVYQMTLGNGKTKAMLWSQMHGNESTATMALFDMFNFLEGRNDGFDDIRQKLLSKLTLRFIPMVNPDGMDQWIRRNALDIDLNRDALALASPEAVLLKNARDQFSPDFGFNLHDQQIYYTAGETRTPATISVLAPAYNFETEVNEVRKKSMQVIVGMNKLIQEVAPGHVGKYDDAFEPRAFGDNFQKWGTSTILIESGGYPNDPEKQYIRKLNFMIMLYALLEIADQEYTAYSLDEYYSIPDNATRLMDLIIRNLPLSHLGHSYQVDLGIRRRETDANGSYYVTGAIDDLGDLSIFYGYEELDAKDLEIVEGKIFETEFDKAGDISKEQALALLRQGYLAVKVKESQDRELYDLPIWVLKNAKSYPIGNRTGNNPNFYLAKNGALKYAVLNGYLIDLEKPAPIGLKMRVL